MNGTFFSSEMTRGYIRSYVQAFFATPVHREYTFAIDLSPFAIVVLLLVGAVLLWYFGAVPRKKLVDELERLLQAEIILIPSMKHDMTGHADGMVRFVDEKTALGNDIRCRDGLERRIKHILKEHGIHVIDFPYREARGISAVGSYLNFLETEQHIFLPVFGLNRDQAAVSASRQIFSKTVIPVSIREIARQGGCLNCISWEWDV